MNDKSPKRPLLVKSYIEGSRRPANIFWALTLTLGGLGFFFEGISSFLEINSLIFLKPSQFSFIPQGIILTFYGTFGLVLGIFLWLIIWWNIGFGYNEYDRKNQKVILYRKGFPGKNREFYLRINLKELRAVKIYARYDLNSYPNILFDLVNTKQIPLASNNKPIPLNKIEKEALRIAKYLDIFFEYSIK